MVGLTEDTVLIRAAVSYVIELYREFTEENGAPTLGTQNQAVDFILADPKLSRAVREWAEHARTDEASTEPRQRLPFDETYRRVAAFLRQVMERPVFTRDDHR
jgi:hypothetical protein